MYISLLEFYPLTFRLQRIITMIKIFTRSINYELYQMSERCIGLDFPRVRLTNTHADGYFYKMLEDTDCDWAINIDEDAFVVNDNAILSLLDYAKKNGIVNCGVSDCLPVRYYNPAVTNPYFNILNLGEIRKNFNIEEIKNFDYATNSAKILAKTPEHLVNHPNAQPNNSNEEPYYNFFLWTALNFKTLYLDMELHHDGISAILKNHDGETILYHSWFSRCWRTDEEQTRRIKNLYTEVALQKGFNPEIPSCWEKITPIDRKIQILNRKIQTALTIIVGKKYTR